MYTASDGMQYVMRIEKVGCSTLQGRSLPSRKAENGKRAKFSKSKEKRKHHLERDTQVANQFFEKQVKAFEKITPKNTYRWGASTSLTNIFMLNIQSQILATM